MNSQYKCQRCQSRAVMPSGVCLSCGLQNPPRVDKAKEAAERQAREAEARRRQQQQTRQQALNQIDQALTLATAGDLRQANELLRQIDGRDRDIHIARTQAEAELWRLQSVPEMQLKTLEKLREELPFDEANLDYYYQLACLYQDGGSAGKALHIFNQFVEKGVHLHRDDILDRWRQLKDSDTAADAGSGAEADLQLWVGGKERASEALRGWVDAANRAQRYFRDSILLNEDDYRSAERISQPFTGDIDLRDILTELNRVLQQEGFGQDIVAELHQLSIRHAGSEASARPATALLLRPLKDPLLTLDSGSLRLATQVMFEGKTGASLTYYECFTPHNPESGAGQQPDPRDFNDSVYQGVTQLQQTPDPQRTRRLQTYRELVKATVETALQKRARGGSQMFF